MFRTCLEYFYYEGYLARSYELGTIWRSPDDRRNDSELAQAAWSVLRESTHARELSLSVLFIMVLWEVHESSALLLCESDKCTFACVANCGERGDSNVVT